MHRWNLLFGLLIWTATGCLEANRFVDPEALRDAAGDSAAQTDATALPDGLGDAGAETDAGTDAEAETDAGTDAGAETDAGTDAGAETDAGTDAGAETVAGTDAEAETDAGTETDTGTTVFPDGLGDAGADTGTDADGGADAETDAAETPDGLTDADSGVVTDAGGEDATGPDSDADDAADSGSDAEMDPDVDPCAGKDCNDFNPCTTDSCAQGQCVHTPANEDCPDDGCWVQFCSQGACKPTGGYLDQGTPCFDKVAGKGGFCSGPTAICGECAFDNQCASDNPCVQPKCTNGSCDVTTLATGLPCSDGDPCTSGDVCGTSLQEGISGCKPGKALAAGSSCTTAQSSKGLCSTSGTCVAPTPGEPFVVFGHSSGCSKPGWSLTATPAGVWATSPASCNAIAQLTPTSSKQAEAVSGPIALPQTAGRLQLEWQGVCLTSEYYDGGGWQTPVTNGTCTLEVSTDNFATVAALQHFPAAPVGTAPSTAAANLTLDLSAYAGKSVRLRLVADAQQSIPLSSPGNGSLQLWLSGLAIRLHDSGLTTCATGADCDDSEVCTLDVCVLGGCTYLPQPDFPCDFFQYVPDSQCKVGGHCDAAGSCVLDYAIPGAECWSDLGGLGTCVFSAMLPGGLQCKELGDPKDPKEPF